MMKEGSFGNKSSSKLPLDIMGKWKAGLFGYILYFVLQKWMSHFITKLFIYFLSSTKYHSELRCLIVSVGNGEFSVSVRASNSIADFIDKVKNLLFIFNHFVRRTII